MKRRGFFSSVFGLASAGLVSAAPSIEPKIEPVVKEKKFEYILGLTPEVDNWKYILDIRYTFDGKNWTQYKFNEPFYISGNVAVYDKGSFLQLTFITKSPMGNRYTHDEIIYT